MSGTAPKSIALFDRLARDQGFAGARTGGLFQQALELAGYRVLDGSRLLAGRSETELEAPDAWISLRPIGLSDGPALEFCRAAAVPYYLVDPLLDDCGTIGTETGLKDMAGGIACCFSPKAERLKQLCPDGGAVSHIPPFLDPEAYFAARRDAAGLRKNLSARYRLPEEFRWIYLSVPVDADSASLYSTFETLSRLAMLEWSLIVGVPGECRGAVEQLLPVLASKPRHLLDTGRPDERLAFMAASDICLCVERRGTALFDVLEALASGLAVVANKSPAVQDVVENGVTGRLSATANPASLSNDLTFLLRHDNFLQSCRNNSRSQVAARHDILVAVRCLRELLEARGV